MSQPSRNGDLEIEIDVAFEGPVFVISIAAQLSGMHPQTLRQYDRLGLVQPGRSAGGGRRYSARDVVLLREIARLSQEEGVNLAGIKRIIALTKQVRDLEERTEQLVAELRAARQESAEMRASMPYRGELVPLDQSVLPVWRPKGR
ncbi:heat shock protein transcriptional repressor HspR [Cryptosporangium phraense]|uniref:Helix-turn-helix transcriptional regulator n=1 Tax=Cryptosporangium phraense TaxID=2593070 RepID=A0A545AI45_9ACTN|nr:helix-turn-helix transcriptional regulator [Cryptosporangium phraense]TQS40991.1 helix-turn-helix transcriptional regulator [Cryptosporangium phraense]